MAIPHWVWLGVLLTICGAALWRGGRDERAAAAAMLAAWVLSTALYTHRGRETELGLLAVDAALFAVLLVVALRSPAYWPMFAAGFQLLTLVTHIARMMEVVRPWAYITAAIIWSYLVVGALAVGVWRNVFSAGEDAIGRPPET